MNTDDRSARWAVRAERALRDVLPELAPASRSALLQRVAALLAEATQEERRRCVRMCRHRAELWRNTLGAHHPAPPVARDEARARQNEARYLADLIEEEQEAFGEPDA